jgi:multidrug resistance efflux pump
MLPRISGWLLLAGLSSTVLVAACVQMAPTVVPGVTARFAASEVSTAQTAATSVPVPATATPLARARLAPTPTPNPLANRQTATVRRGPISDVVEVGGRVTAVREAPLSFAIRGTVDSVGADSGQQVHEGDVLLTLDTGEARGQLTDLRGQVEITRARQAQLASRLEQARRQQDAAAAAQRDAASRAEQRSRQKVADATAQAEEQLRLASVNFERVRAGATPADRLAADTAIATARANLAKAEADRARLANGPTPAERRAAEQAVATAETALKKAQSDRDKLLRPPDPVAVANARKEVADAQAGVERAANGDSSPNAPKISAAERESRQQAAEFGLRAAKQALDTLMKGADPATLELSAMAVKNAESALASSQAQLAELVAPPTQTQLDAAASAVEVARLALAGAEAHRAELASHPTVEELRVAQKAVDDAQASLDRAAIPPDEATPASPGAAAAPAAEAPTAVDQLTLQHTLEQQLAQMRTLERQLATSELRAPFDGVVSSIQVKAGDPVDAHRPVVVVASADSPIVIATVSEEDAARMPVGLPALLQVEASTVQVQGALVAYTDASGGGRQAVVQAAWPEMFPPLGARVDLSVTVGHKDLALLLPSRAIKATADRRTVEVVDAGQRRIVEIKVGIASGDDVEVLSGLAEGQVVLLPN